MSELIHLQKKQNRMYILVCINFLFFMFIFAGLGLVIWKSAALVSRLNADLGRAEQTITQLQSRFEDVNTDAIVERLVNTASEQLGSAIRATIESTDLARPIAEISLKIAKTQEIVGKSSEAMQRVQEKMSQLDNDEIAQRVSYHVIKGLGDGLQKVADERLPTGQGSIKTKADEIPKDK